MIDRKRRSVWAVAVLCLFLAAGLSSCFGVTANSAKSARDKLLEYYAEAGESKLNDSAEALILLSAGGLVSQETVERLLPSGDQAQSIATLCSSIYLAEFAKLDSRSYLGQNLVALLAERQLEDGSFGFLEETVSAALTLENVGASYDRDGVIRLLIAAQRPDGGFCAQKGAEPDLTLTGLTLSLLPCFGEDYRAAILEERAVEYLKQYSAGMLDPPPDCAALSAAICGLVDAGQDLTKTEWTPLISALLNCETKSGGFSAQPDLAADPDSTSAALAALEAVDYGGSWWNTAIQRSGVVSLSIVANGTVLHQTGRFGLLDRESALSLTSRFCAANGIEIEFRLGRLLSVDGHEKSGNQDWKLSINGAEASPEAPLSAGDEVVWNLS
ncbi:MAG: hypothetical protein IJL39_00420 [Clostridia bacterium]|nr:hypothetical protein [Clostridia bacterium]